MKRIILILSALALLASCSPSERRVMARYVPERADDFVFENNLIAGRFYGQALEGNPTSPGVDVWVKLPGRLVANEWYEKAVAEDPDYYHHDHGGKDCYKVAVSLGGGASVPYIDGVLCYPATNYRSYEIVEDGPEKVSFVLHYPEWEAAEGIKVSLDKKVTVIPDTYFVNVEDQWSFTGAEELPIAAGFKLHTDLETVETSEFGPDRWAIWEKASDQSIEPEDGMLGIAVVMDGAEDSILREDLDHALLVKTVKSGETLSYSFGSCWSKGEVKTAEQWFDIVKNQ